MTTKDEALALALEAHKKLIRAYVNLLETGRDRIISHGGTCDSVEQMEASDPALREAREAITAIKQAQEPKVKLIPTAEEMGTPMQAQEPVGLNRPEIASYVARYGGNCRDCANENGICSSSGMPCDSHKAINHVLTALDYGLKHGYITATHPAPKQAEPEGYKLVPVEPTQEMLDAVVTSVDDHLLGPDAEKQYREDWAAMLAAAPTPPEAA